MKKIVVLAGLMLFLSGPYVFADNIQLGLMASGDAVMGSLEFQAKQDFGIIAAGGAMDYARGEYTLGEGLVAFRSDNLLPGLKFGLGFKGYLGKMDSEDDSTHGDVSAIAFLLEGAYELPATINPIPLPLEAFGAICFSPSSLSFDETESLQEYKGGLRLYLIENAYLSIECKYRKIEFEEHGIRSWDRDDTLLSGGVTLRF